MVHVRSTTRSTRRWVPHPTKASILNPATENASPGAKEPRGGKQREIYIAINARVISDAGQGVARAMKGGKDGIVE